MKIKIDELNDEINKLILEINDKPINNIKIVDNIEDNKKIYKPDELTDDRIPNIDTQLKELREKDQEMMEKYKKDDIKLYNKEMIQRVKCLSLNKMNKNIFTNTNNLNKKDRNKLQEIMWSYNDIEHKKIIDEFNDLVCDILDDVNIDYSKLPIYNN